MLGNSTLEDTKKDRTGMDTNIKIHNLEDHYLEETHPRNDTTQQDIMWTGKQPKRAHSVREPNLKGHNP